MVRFSFGHGWSPIAPPIRFDSRAVCVRQNLNKIDTESH
jgi:hypothetical protein